MSTTPNQSFLVKQMQFRLAAAFGCILWDFGVNAKNIWAGWNNPVNAIWTPTGWRVKDQTFYYRPNWGGGAGNAHVIFHQRPL